MKVFKIHLYSWTASFRYPNIITGFQPTLDVPPLSTINGLISAAAGYYFFPDKEKIGYVFRYESKNVDLETIYQMGQSLSGIKSNVIKREFLFNVNLFIYTDSENICNYFKNPTYQLLLGRSSDLASVRSITEINVVEKKQLTQLKGTIIPFKKYKLPGMLQGLPVGFSNEIPRKNIGVKPYLILDCNYSNHDAIEATGFFDENNNWDVYWQEIS